MGLPKPSPNCPKDDALLASLTGDMFDHAPRGMIVYQWAGEDAPDEMEPVMQNQAAEYLVRATGDTIDEDWIRDHCRLCLQTGQEQRWELVHEHPNRQRTHWEVRCFNLRDRYVGVVFEDVTAERALQAKFQQTIQELERTNANLDEFAYLASHDLRAPLRTVETLAKWLCEDLQDSVPERSRKHLEQMRQRVRRMSGLLQDLLTYSRANRLLEGPEEFDVLEACRSGLAHVTVPDGYVLNLPDQGVTVRTPRAPFEQVIRALVENGFKHHDRDTGRVSVYIEEEPERLRITVEDDGPGIAPRYHGRVFGVFQTLRPRDEREGSGMGLALVRRIVEHFGQRVDVSSKEGDGACFSFGWPLVWGATVDLG